LAPESLAHFRFDGNGNCARAGNVRFDLRNTKFQNNALLLHGKYEFNANEDGYRAVCEIPGLDCTKFTVAIRFKAEEFGPGKNNLITAGTSRRWFGMNVSPAEKLTVTFNNQDFACELNEATIKPRTWNVVVCGVDISKRKAVVYVNGTKASDIDFPKNFKLRGGGTDTKANEWSFTNYSNGNTFHGLVDELVIYPKMLTAEEFAAVPLRP
jgi:hypothetical protein